MSNNIKYGDQIFQVICFAAEDVYKVNEARAFCGDELYRSWPYEQPS